jgi:hypothetical protein
VPQVKADDERLIVLSPDTLLQKLDGRLLLEREALTY